MTNKEKAFKTIAELIDRFNEHIDTYKKGDYNETQTRVDYINPLFEALGWDINNKEGLAESYREVIHEAKLTSRGATKAPDYCFTVYGQRKFFLEAKKPSINIKDNVNPSYQVRRYGWSAKMPISILTDFEEFAVYDCSKKPNPGDKSSVARINYFKYNNYLSEFDYLWDTFSKEKVLKGSFDKYVQSDTYKRGTSTVDKSFLETLENMRNILTKGICKHNSSIIEEELNHVVQINLDRIIFLRIAEDRGIEPYGDLKNSITTGNYFENVINRFERAEKKYNTGLFNFKKDQLSKNIIIDNKLIKELITNLYYPYSPYEFSVLGTEILGSVYERFLGKVIRLTPGHHVKIEEKPEVRKAGGVYYTPQYVVDYIVKNTVGKFIKSETFEEVKKIKILDPACGSGSFLIGAYQYLLDFYKNYYQNKYNINNYKGVVKNVLTPQGTLTTSEKKRILLDHIYGVDIDNQAVEVTKLSLLLKTLEGETEASINNELLLFHERVLPDLEDNIKSGNSLIDLDYYDGVIDFEIDIEKKIKPFNWKKNFPEIIKNGGFDCIIGNPPYGADMQSNNYLKNKFTDVSDSYLVFMERVHNLIKDKGVFSFIVPTSWLSGVRFRNFRHQVFELYKVEKVITLPFDVFEEAYIDTCIFVFSKTTKPTDFINVFTYKKKDRISSLEFADKNLLTIKANSIRCDENLTISTNPFVYQLRDRFNNSKFELLGEISNSTIGVLASKYHIIDRPEESYQKYFIGNIYRYEFKHLETNYINLSKHRTEYLDYYFNSKKIWIRRIISRQNRILCTIPPDNYCVKKDIYSFTITAQYDERYLLALLNSKLLSYIYLNLSAISTKDDFRQTTLKELRALPIRKINLNNKDEKSQYDELIKLVDKLLKLNIEKVKIKLPDKLSQINAHSVYLDEKIDIIVFGLYNLNDNDIKTIKSHQY